MKLDAMGAYRNRRGDRHLSRSWVAIALHRRMFVAKSDRIFELGCESLARRMSNPGLLSRYRSTFRDRSMRSHFCREREERILASFKGRPRWASEFKADSFATWYYGYVLLFLGRVCNCHGRHVHHARLGEAGNGGRAWSKRSGALGA